MFFLFDSNYELGSNLGISDSFETLEGAKKYAEHIADIDILWEDQSFFDTIRGREVKMWVDKTSDCEFKIMMQHSPN